MALRGAQRSWLECVDLAMKQLAPGHWVRFKLDFISFYYKSNMMAVVDALIEKGMFKQVMHLKAAFAHRSSMVVVYNSADQGRVILKAPPNGFPAGHRSFVGKFLRYRCKIGLGLCVESLFG